MSETPSPFAVLDRIPLGACVLGRGLVVRFWNACLEEWTGIDRRQVLGEVLSERFGHLGEPPYLPRFEAIFEGGPPTVFSSQLHPHLIPAPLPDGRLRIQHTVVTGIPGADGAEALVSIQDVTDPVRRLEDYRKLRDRALQEVQERKRAEQERRRLEGKIQQAQKLESLGVLAGGIAHDFNNILVGILGSAELALTELPHGTEARRLIERVIEAAQRAAELANQMLAYSGKGRFEAVALNLSEWIREMVPLVKSSISKKAELRCDLPPDLPAIEADPAQIRQVVMNLVTNASDALGETSGLISISTGAREFDRAALSRTYPAEDLPEGGYVFLEVADTGCGMAPETLEKIFDPFFSTKFAGRGLGLAAVLGIVRGHRGALQVESEPGCGTTFRALFPPSGAGAAAAREPREEGRWSAADTVLVVDDEEMVRFLARKALERSGFAVLTASDGREGVEVFRAHADRIAVVLLDMTMPELSGEEAFREIRGIRPDVRVILTSGYTEQQATEQLAGRGVAAFIKKPYRPRDLVAKVLEVLGG